MEDEFGRKEYGEYVFYDAKSVFVRISEKISHVSTYSDLWLIIPGILAFCAPYLRFSQYKNLYFRYAFLASVLMFVVLFSTGSESSTYIIAFVGVALWFVAVPWKRSRWDIALMILLLS